MHNHGSWEGPVRGSAAWWRGTAPPEEPAQEEEKTPSKKEAGIRWDLVERVKKEIADGVYDTPEKWNAALDKLLDRLND